MTKKHPAYPRIERIARVYGLRIRAIRPCHSFYRRNTAFRVSTDGGDVLIKPFKGTLRQLRRLHGRLQRLRQSGFKHMPVWLHTRKGGATVLDKNQWFYGTEWVRGRELALKERDLHYLGRAIAELHSSSRKLVPRRTIPARTIQALQRQDNRFRRQLRIPVSCSKVHSWFRRHGHECVTLANESWNLLEGTQARRAVAEETHSQAWIHGDVTRFNALVRENGVCLIDWDSMKLGSPLQELVKTLANTANFDPLYMRALLDGYEDVHPLSAGERIVICAFFRFPREAWIVRNRCRGRTAPPEFSVLRNTWSARLRAVEWMDDWANVD